MCMIKLDASISIFPAELVLLILVSYSPGQYALFIAYKYNISYRTLPSSSRQSCSGADFQADSCPGMSLVHLINDNLVA